MVISFRTIKRTNMKKILFALFAVGAMTLTSCHQDDVPATAIEVVGEGISNNQVEMISGNTLQLGVVFTPSNTTRKTVVYSSDNEAVATVSADGVITAHDNGWATITIRNAEWPYASTKLRVHVTGATLPVAGDEVSQGEAEARKMASPDE